MIGISILKHNKKKQQTRLNVCCIDQRINFCSTCKMYRPPGTHHCRLCDNCIQRFDHHCPFIGNCVGLRNYRFFVGFITSLSIYIIVVIGMTIFNLAYQTEQNGGSFGEAVKVTWGSLITLVIAGFSIFPVSSLTCFHFGLLGSNRTTKQYINESGKFKCSDMITNFFKMIAEEMPMSLVDGRKHVSTQDPMENKPNYPDSVSDFTSIKVFEITEQIL